MVPLDARATDSATVMDAGQPPAIEATALVPANARAVFVAPHPDDEVLGAGGLLTQLAAAGRQQSLIAVTDGEASHPGSRRYTPSSLAKLRVAETHEALAQLGLTGLQQHRLRLPDRRLHEQRRRVEDALTPLLHRGDIIFTTWREDRHSDHRAVGEVVAALARQVGGRLIELPIWTDWQRLARHGDWRRARRVELSPRQREAKRRAVAAYRTQLVADPDVEGGAVLPSSAVASLLHGDEIMLT